MRQIVHDLGDVGFFDFFVLGFLAAGFVHRIAHKHPQRLFNIPFFQTAFARFIQIKLLVKRKHARRKIFLRRIFRRLFGQVQNQAFLAVAVGVEKFIRIIKQHRACIGVKHFVFCLAAEAAHRLPEGCRIFKRKAAPDKLITPFQPRAVKRAV